MDLNVFCEHRQVADVRGYLRLIADSAETVVQRAAAFVVVKPGPDRIKAACRGRGECSQQ